jgi:hypothetical protein
MSNGPASLNAWEVAEFVDDSPGRDGASLATIATLPRRARKYRGE